MLSSSFAFRRAVAQGCHLENKVVLTLADGTVHELAGADLAMGGVSCSGGTSQAGAFGIGAAIVGTSDITLINYDQRWDDTDFTDATITLNVGVAFEDGATEWLRKGVYNLEQPEEYGSTIGITSYDNMVRFQRPYADVGTVYPATLRTIVADVASACGVRMARASFPRDAQVVSRRPRAELTSCLDVLSWAAQMACCFADIDPWGMLRLRWYDTAAYEAEDWTDGGTYDTASTPYTDGDRAEGGGFHTDSSTIEGGEFAAPRWATITAIRSLTVATDDVVITGVRVTAADDEGADGTQGDAGETYLYGEEGYVLSISDNELVQRGSARSVAESIGATVVGMRFRPLRVTSLGDPTIEPGDPVLVIDRRQRTYRSWATSLTWKAGGMQSISCDAETPARNRAEAHSASTRAIVQQRNRLIAERTARQAALETLAEEIANSSGLFTTDELQQDGSTIHYAHDKPTLAESSIVWKFTANAFAWSTDGGKTYPYGIDVTGSAILDRIYAIGIDAEYVNTGRVAMDGNGYIDFGLRTFALGNLSTIAGRTAQSVLTDVGTASSNAASAIEYARDVATLEITSTHGQLFKNGAESTVLKVAIFPSHGERLETIEAVRERFGASAYIQWRWMHDSSGQWGTILSTDPHVSHGGMWLTVGPDDVDVKTTFEASLVLES